MFGMGAILGIVWIVYNLLKEAFEPTIPAENWRNQELINKDMMDVSISAEDFIRNVKNGKYK